MTILESRPLEVRFTDETRSSRQIAISSYEKKSSIETAKAAILGTIDDWLGKRPLLIDLVLDEAVRRSGIPRAAKEYVHAAYWRLVSDKRILKDSSSLIILP